MKKVLINATAAKSSGALSILTDFIHFLEINKNLTTDIDFYLFTSVENFNESKKIEIIKQSNDNWLKRIIWDYSGLNNWCKINKIVPDLLISFQNTCTRFTGIYKNTPQLVYYHQPLPLVKYKWNCFDKDEFKLYLYAKFYGLFVNKYNSNAAYVVQLPYIKSLFIKKFPNVSEEKIHVIRPNIQKINVDLVEIKDISEDITVLLYPATPLSYKNHIVLIKAFEKIVLEHGITNKLVMYFTIKQEGFIYNEILKRNLTAYIKCIGSVPFDELLTYYKRANIILFPSKIETFGLPLIEASMFGTPIIASNLPYAREVLENYNNVTFCNPEEENEWTLAIKQQLKQNKKKANLPYIENTENSWNEFLDIARSLIK